MDMTRFQPGAIPYAMRLATWFVVSCAAVIYMVDHRR
jgi:hypothetical protein